MSNRKQVVDSIIFDHETTTNTDFRGYDFQPYVQTVYKDKIRAPKESKELLKYVHTVTDWKQVMPFDAMIERKPILRTNPNEIQTPYEKPPDLEKEKIRKTRPRMVMTPSVDIDSLDAKTYALLVKDKYKTQMMKHYGYGGEASSIRAPLNGKYAPTMPVLYPVINISNVGTLALPSYKPPLVAPEWRMESASWDRRQRRDYCDATKVFWLNRGKERPQRTL